MQIPEHAIEKNEDNFTTSTPPAKQAQRGFRCSGETMELFPVVTEDEPSFTTVSFQAMDYNNVTTDRLTTIVEHITPRLGASQGFPQNEIHNIILYSIVLFLAVVGNVLAIITLLANRRMRTVASCFLLSMSVSNLLLAVICMPISLTGRILKKFIFGRVMCKVMPTLMGMSVCVSTFTMLAISVERYYAICRPLKSRAWQTVSHAYKVIFAIWVVSCVLSTPYFFLSDIHYIPLIDYGRCAVACRLSFPSASATQAWYLFLLLTLFFIPGVLMTAAYSLISCKIWKEFKVKSHGINVQSGESVADEDHDTSDGLYITPRRRNVSFRRLRHSVKRLLSRSESHSTANDTTDTDETTTSSLLNQPVEIVVYSPSMSPLTQTEGGRRPFKREIPIRRRIESRSFRSADKLQAKKKVVRMLIVIVILFFVCWTPLFIVNVWKAFDPRTAVEKLDGIIEIIQLMSYVSTCINPLVYCFMNQNFRSGFLNVFLYCVPGVQKKPLDSVRKSG